MGQGLFGEKLEDHYVVSKVTLGQGSFGTVRRAVDLKSNEVVAVKELDKQFLRMRGVTMRDVEREIRAMKAVKHRNINLLLGTFEDSTAFYLALEYCDGGDLGDKMKEGSFKEKEAVEWMRQIVSPIAALHSKGVCHRDIKPENYMICRGFLKLSDFGLAISFSPTKLITDKCGTLAYMSPEQYLLPKRSKGYNNLCDVWAAGVITYMMMFGGVHPFLDSQQRVVERRLLDGTLDYGIVQGLFRIGAYSESAKRFCGRLVEPEPSRRASADDALMDRWLLGSTCTSFPGSALQTTLSTSSISRQRTVGEVVPVVLGSSKYDEGGVSRPQSKVDSQVEHVSPSSPDKALQGSPSFFSAFGCFSEGGAFDLWSSSPSCSVRPKAVIAYSATAQLGGIDHTPLPPGTRCRFRPRSSAPPAEWAAAEMESFDHATGMYNLDVHRLVLLDNIFAPSVDTPPSAAWPPRTRVSYESTTAQIWVPATILGFANGKYDLDVRRGADPDRIRLRL